MVWSKIAPKKKKFFWKYPLISALKNGQSLVEVLASVSIVLFIIFGVISLTNYTLKNSTFSKNQTLATKYAQEKLEEIRTLRDKSPEVFWLKTGTEEDNIGIFTRQVIYEQILNEENEATQTAVTVLVWWEDQSGKHYSKVGTLFGKW